MSRLSEILLTNICILLHGLVCFASLHFLVGDKLVCWRSQILAELQQCCLSVRKVSIRHFVVQVHLSWLTGGSHVPSADLRWENHPPTSPFCFAFFKHGDYWLVYEKDGPLQIQGRYGSNRMIEGLKAFLEGVTSAWDSLNKYVHFTTWSCMFCLITFCWIWGAFVIGSSCLSTALKCTLCNHVVVNLNA